MAPFGWFGLDPALIIADPTKCISAVKTAMCSPV